MYREEKVEEALEACRDIEIYYKKSPAKNPYEQFRQTQAFNTEGLLPFLPEEEVQISIRPGLSSINRVFRFFIELFFCMLTAFALAYFLTGYVAQHTRVDGISMENSLHDGDYLMIDKLTYHFAAPKRYDIIIFPFEEDVYYIKRVIGLPGETVRIRGKDILINGKKLTEGYGREPITYAGAAAQPVTLKEGEYFVLGDNRSHSMDSRYEEVGKIHRKDIVGRAFLRIYPFSSFGLLKHG